MHQPTSPTGLADTPEIRDYGTWRDNAGSFAPVGPPAPCTYCGIPVVRLVSAAIRSDGRDMEIDRVRCETSSDGYHHLPDVL